MTVYIDGQLFYQANLKYPITDVSPAFTIQELSQVFILQLIAQLQ